MIKGFFKLFIKNSASTEDPAVRNAYGKLLSITGIILNALLFAFKTLAGVISGSVAIIADAVNNLSDASGNIVAFLGFRLSEKPADADHPYGHGRYEYVSGLLVCFIILVVGAELLITGVKKIINPAELSFSLITLIILIVSIAVKIIMAIYNGYAGKLINSETLLATSEDSRNDAVATTGVLAGVLVFRFTGVNIDGYLSVAVALFIILGTFSLLKETIGLLLGKKTDKTLAYKIRSEITSHKGVSGLHDLMVHDYGPGCKFASAHVEMSSKADPLVSHQTIDDTERDVLTKLGVHLTLHYDPVDDDNPAAVRLKEFLSETVKNIDKDYSVHDVRIIRRYEKDIAVFDMVLPYGDKKNKEEIKRIISSSLKSNGFNYDINVTFENNFA